MSDSRSQSLPSPCPLGWKWVHGGRSHTPPGDARMPWTSGLPEPCRDWSTAPLTSSFTPPAQDRSTAPLTSSFTPPAQDRSRNPEAPGVRSGPEPVRPPGLVPFPVSSLLPGPLKGGMGSPRGLPSQSHGLTLGPNSTFPSGGETGCSIWPNQPGKYLERARRRKTRALLVVSWVSTVDGPPARLTSHHPTTRVVAVHTELGRGAGWVPAEGSLAASNP